MIVYIYMRDNHGELDTLNYDRKYTYEGQLNQTPSIMLVNIYERQSRRTKYPQL